MEDKFKESIKEKASQGTLFINLEENQIDEIFEDLLSLLVAHDHNPLTIWSALAFHWLTGLRHILAEHFTQPHIYQKINSLSANLLIIALWCLITVLIIYQAWSGFTV